MMEQETRSKPLAPSSPVMRGLLALVMMAASLLAMSTWRVYGHTWDEPEHLAAGMELLDRGRYEYDMQHPPLARLMIALGPYLAGARSTGSPPPDGTPEGVAILYGSGHYDRYLTLARLGTLPFLGLLLIATWLWARRLLSSDRVALLAVVLLVATPPILGHAALATLDVPAAATTLLALYVVQLWVCVRGWRETVLLGLATGVAFATKLSAVPFLLIGMIVLNVLNATCRRSSHDVTPAASLVRERAHRYVLQLLAAAVVAAACLVLASGGRVDYFTDSSNRPNTTLNYLFGEVGRCHDIAYALAAHVPLPLGLRPFVEGIRAVLWHNEIGHLSYLLGHTATHGWWYFYPVALAVKTPIPMLIAGPIGLVILARDGWRARDSWRIAPLLLGFSLLAFASLYSHINIGIRHVLILYPFLALGSAHVLALAWHRMREVSNRDRAGVAAAAIIIFAGWQISTVATANPDYLPYFNEAVADPEKVLVDSDLAWGQDLRRLERRLAELKVPAFSFAYLGTADLKRETFPTLTRLAPGHPTTGWVAITALARVHAQSGYAWLDAYTPVEKIGKSIDLYFIPDAR